MPSFNTCRALGVLVFSGSPPQIDQTVDGQSEGKMATAGWNNWGKELRIWGGGERKLKGGWFMYWKGGGQDEHQRDHDCLSVTPMSGCSPAVCLQLSACSQYICEFVDLQLKYEQKNAACIRGAWEHDAGNIQLCRSSYSSWATKFQLVSILTAPRHCSSLNQWIFCTGCEEHLLVCWRQMPEVAGSKWPVRRQTLWRSISQDSTTQCYNKPLPWKPDWVGPLGEWQRGFDLTSEGYRWQCFINSIIRWVTRDTHTPLRWGKLGVRSPEEA